MYSLPEQLEIGKAFEISFAHLLEAKGWTVNFNDAADLPTLQKYDLHIRKPGFSYWLELKKDVMSQETGNVCLELEALRHSQASIFVLGLPNLYGTDIFTMPLKTVHRFAEAYPVKKRVGQWKTLGVGDAAIVPKSEFLTLPFIKRFSMEESILPYGKEKVLTKGLAFST